MFSSKATELKATIDALDHSQAVIEFKMDGTIITANENFLKTLGYTPRGNPGPSSQHVRDGNRQAERGLPAVLGRPEPRRISGRRIQARRQGRQGSLDPGELQPDHGARTASRSRSSSSRPTSPNASCARPTPQGQIAAIGKSQAVIHFNMDGTIVTANENFLNALGYTPRRNPGPASQHVRRGQGNSRAPAYRQFWEALDRGEYQAGRIQARRQGRQGSLDPGELQPDLRSQRQAVQGRQVRDRITQQQLRDADSRGQIDAISKSQAVIQFNLDGTIITANENFLKTLGYRLDEIQGRHHSMFVEATEKQSAAYRQFWAALDRGEYQAARIQAHRQRRQGSLDPGALQSDPRPQRQAVQGRQVRHRYYPEDEDSARNRSRSRHDCRCAYHRQRAGHRRGERVGRDLGECPGGGVGGGGVVGIDRRDQPAGRRSHQDFRPRPWNRASGRTKSSPAFRRRRAASATSST